ncbi:MAG: 2-oxo acid dehydrogenase subunit E2 [Chloroflexi bacterium]|nr:2-oxo acid dehydrogenase subunit E2 [Chloroflexota bacterium]
MPQLGMMMVAGTLTHWLVADGASVKKGEELLEIETDKVVQTITAPVDGVVKYVAAEGEVVPVLQVLGYILTVGEVAAEPGEQSPRSVAVPPSSVPLAQVPGAGPAGRIRSTPIARRIAALHGIDLATLVGSGPGARIVEADVRAAVQKAAALLKEPQRRVLRSIPLTGRRAVIARRMVESLAQRAQLTIVREIDATELVKTRQALVARASELGVRVSYDAILAKALATALTEQPILNASIESGVIVVWEEVNVGIAIATPVGLVVPVVPNAHSRPLVEIAGAIEDFATRAANRKLLPDEMTGGTVTITNVGLFGIDLFTPILNPPESAILGLGRIASRPFVVGERLTVRPTLHLSLTWDHQVTDGAEAGQLLGRIAEMIGDRRYLSSLA